MAMMFRTVILVRLQDKDGGQEPFDIDFHPDPGTPTTPLAKGGGHVDLPAAPCLGQD